MQMFILYFCVVLFCFHGCLKGSPMLEYEICIYELTICAQFFSKYLFSTYYYPNTILGARNISANINIHASELLIILQGEDRQLAINIRNKCITVFPEYLWGIGSRTPPLTTQWMLAQLPSPKQHRTMHTVGPPSSWIPKHISKNTVFCL